MTLSLNNGPTLEIRRPPGHQYITVGIFPANSENAKSVARCLRDQVNFRTVGLIAREHYSLELFNHYDAIDLLPPLTKPEDTKEFMTELNKLATRTRMSCLIPTHDTTAMLLADCPSLRVITSTFAVTQQCRDKHLTYKLFKDYAFCPKVYTDYQRAKNKVLGGESIYSKPAVSQGGRGNRIVTSPAEFEVADMVNTNSTQVLMECIGHSDSQEVTVDCFSKFDTGELLVASPRERGDIRNGISNSCKFINGGITGDLMTEVAGMISRLLRPTGIWYFQMKLGLDGKFKLLEVSCRPSTGVDFQCQIGINLPAMAVYDALGFPVETPRVTDNMFRLRLSRSSVIRHIDDCPAALMYRNVFIDLFDTIAMETRPPGFYYASPRVMAFIYDCIASGIKVHLVTRINDVDYGEDRIEGFLNKHKVHPSLFASIQLLNAKDKKSDAIRKVLRRDIVAGKLRTLDSIFVDNSFKERQEVLKNVNIPVFDVNAIDCLLSKIG